MNLWYQESELGKYRYTVVTPVSFLLPELHRNYDITKPEGDKAKLAEIRKSLLTIFPGYAFDGATGGPDFKFLIRAVVLHDLLCQLCLQPNWPITRFKADKIFLREARRSSPLIGPIFYTAIRIGGGLHKLFNPPTPADGIAFKIV